MNSFCSYGLIHKWEQIDQREQVVVSIENCISFLTSKQIIVMDGLTTLK